jgi:ectonucleoside triphosphate diphosphohydrolase 5/6
MGIINFIMSKLVWKSGFLVDENSVEILNGVGNNYFVSGKEANKKSIKSEVDYDICVEAVKNLILPLITPRPNLKNQKIYAFSFFRNIRIRRWRWSHSRKVCSTSSIDQPFMCLDLVFIKVLLTDGYGLKPDTSLNVRKRYIYWNV